MLCLYWRYTENLSWVKKIQPMPTLSIVLSIDALLFTLISYVIKSNVCKRPSVWDNAAGTKL